MERDFERFRGEPNEDPAKRLYVTLSTQNQILLNRRAYELLGRPSAVHLYYSRERDAIGIEVTSPRLNNAFPVMPNGPAGWRISAAPFCRHFNISVETTSKFVQPEFKGNTLTLKLGEIVSVARPKRRRPKPKAK
jgi:hypothetical protein